MIKEFFHILRNIIVNSGIYNILLLAKIFHSIYVISIFYYCKYMVVYCLYSY